jgi:hypothetical protein
MGKPLAGGQSRAPRHPPAHRIQGHIGVGIQRELRSPRCFIDIYSQTVLKSLIDRKKNEETGVCFRK